MTQVTQVAIYMLAEPDRPVVRYIGQTRLPMRRQAQHTERPRLATRDWINSLRRRGLVPRFMVIEVVSNGNGSIHELKWWRHFKGLGHPLLNSAGEVAKWHIAERKSQKRNLRFRTSVHNPPTRSPGEGLTPGLS